MPPGPRWRGPGQRVALAAAPASTPAPGGLGARGVFCVSVLVLCGWFPVLSVKDTV